MNFVITILFMIIIGAVIGGFTNSLAIKMLFRPYKPVFIGNWRVPFTPGLIPKRRDELAEQLGVMVVEHLLTPESIQRKFLNEGFQKEITSMVQKELQRLLNSDETLKQLLDRFEISVEPEEIEQVLERFLEKKYNNLMDKYRHQPIKSLLTEEFIKKINSKIPLVSDYILQKGIDYFSSIEGELQIERMIDDFVKQRSGMLGNMMQMLLGNVNLTDKVQKEIIKFLNSEGTEELITTLLRKEWDKVLDWKAEEIEEQFDRKQLILMIKLNARKLIGMERIFATPVSELSNLLKDYIIDKIVPFGIQRFGAWLSERIEMIMGRLHLADIVREQVESFSVERLEEMVLLITRRELKMITFLGAFLGGFIGFFQGILIFFIA